MMLTVLNLHTKEHPILYIITKFHSSIPKRVSDDFKSLRLRRGKTSALKQHGIYMYIYVKNPTFQTLQFLINKHINKSKDSILDLLEAPKLSELEIWKFTQDQDNRIILHTNKNIIEIFNETGSKIFGEHMKADQITFYQLTNLIEKKLYVVNCFLQNWMILVTRYQQNLTKK